MRKTMRTTLFAVGVLLALAGRVCAESEPAAKSDKAAKPAKPAKADKPIDPYSNDEPAPKNPISGDKILDPFPPGTKAASPSPLPPSYPPVAPGQPSPMPQQAPSPPYGGQYAPPAYPQPGQYPGQYPPAYPYAYPPQAPYGQEPYPAPYYPVPPPGAAPGYPYAPPQYPPRQAEPPESSSHARFLLRPSIGFGYRYALGESMYGAHLETLVGGGNDSWGAGGQLAFLLGRTQHNLEFQWIHLGPGFLFRVAERVQLGFGAKLGWLIIQRATRSFAGGDDDIWSMSLGVHVDLTVDLWRARSGRAFLLGARVGYDYVFEVVDLTPHSLLTSVFLGYQL